MNPLTSTIIDDESLLDQLRMYGETNLPLLPGQATSTMRGTRGKKPKNAYLNDSNRDIYLKKLNHYKAREKIETNPSVQYLKTQPGANRQSIDIKRISNIYKVHDDDIQEVEEIESHQKDDVIELDKTEYVQVVNGCTSPLSMSDYDSNNSQRFDEDDFAPLSSTRAPSMGSQARSPVTRVPKSPQEQREKHGYVNLKDRIELDQTLSKYRADIENILHQSVRRNQRETGSAAARYLNDDVLNNYKKSPKTQKITYVPKQEPIDLTGEDEPGFFGSFKSKLFGKSQSSSDNYEGLRKRERYDRNEKPNLPPLPSKVPQSQTSLFTWIGNFISSAGMQVATVLPYIVFIILAVVALQYVHLKFMKTGDFDGSALETGKVLVNQMFNTADTAGTKEKDLDTVAAALYCADIKDTKCAGTKALLREMIDYLRQRSGQVDCTASASSNINPPSDKKVMLQQQFNEKCIHLNELIEHLVTSRGLISNPEVNQKVAIDSALSAISKNPHWEILMLDSNFNEVQDYENVNYLISLVSSKSLGCRLKELAYFIYVRIVIIGMGLIAMVLLYFVFKTYRNNRAAKDKEYYDLITKVTNMVEKQYELSLLDPANIKPYIAISHIYDSLVAPHERAAKKKLWNKIVNFIQDHESRIHLETQFINGEETHVWKWIVAKHESVLKNKYQDNTAGMGLGHNNQMMSESTNYNSMSQHPQMTQDSRVETVQTNGWQGSAFNRKPQNEKLVCSPTPCLKVRNMFELVELDQDRNLPHKIHNSILEKCMINNINKTILHIACDKKSREGCVYIKCASNDAAGLVYTALNGIWYNGKLLNVKFLRSDRYVERFPESLGYNHPIKPIKF